MASAVAVVGWSSAVVCAVFAVDRRGVMGDRVVGGVGRGKMRAGMVGIRVGGWAGILRERLSAEKTHLTSDAWVRECMVML